MTRTIFYLTTLLVCLVQAFDIFLADVALNSGTEFPLFSPFTFETVSFQGLDWLGVQIIGVSVVAITSYFYKRKEIRVKNNLTKT